VLLGTSIEGLANNQDVIQGAKLMDPYVTADMVVRNDMPMGSTHVRERRSHDRRHVDRVVKSFEKPNMDDMLKSQIRATFLGAAAIEVAPEDDNRHGVIDRRRIPDPSEVASPETFGATPFLR